MKFFDNLEFHVAIKFSATKAIQGHVGGFENTSYRATKPNATARGFQKYIIARATYVYAPYMLGLEVLAK